MPGDVGGKVIEKAAASLATVLLAAALAAGGGGACAQTPPPSGTMAPASDAQPVSTTCEEGAAPASAPQKPKSTFEWNFQWAGWNGLRYDVLKTFPTGAKVQGPKGSVWLDTTQLAFSGKFGAKVALDAATFWNQQGPVEAEDGWEVRRARVYWSGDVFLLTPMSFCVEMGFSAGKFYTEETYLALEGFPALGVVKMGQYQAPMSLEAKASGRDWTFMEPSTAVMALAPGTSAGLQVGRAALNERLTWAFGLFTNPTGKDYGDASKSATRVMGRVTYLLVDRRDAPVPDLVHLGLSASHLYSGSDTVRYKSRPESRLAPYMADTGDLRARSADTVGLEAAWVSGGISVQGEALQARINTEQFGNRVMRGGYVYASWFLTGESRPYNPSTGVFVRLKPFRDFSFKGGGRGALEAAVRWSVLDLNDGPVQGGKMRTFTAGINWYLHAHSKVRLNVVRARCDRPGQETRLNVAEIRFEFDF